MSGENCEHCGELIPEEKSPSLIASGGWCIPAEMVYQILALPVLCGDCHARWSVMMELGIDPGKNGENLRISRDSFVWEQE